MHRLAIAIVIAAAGSGCQSAPPLRPAEINERTLAALAAPQRAALERLPAYVIHFARGLRLEMRDGVPALVGDGKAVAGSGVALAPDTLLLCAHQVWGVEPVEYAFVADRARRVVGLEVGPDGDDWAVLRIDPPLEQVEPIAVDRAPLPPGRELVLAGYWPGHPPAMLASGAPDMVRTYLRVRTTKTPWGCPDHLIHTRPCDFDRVSRLDGLSGGPAVAWDEARRAYVLVGITSRSYWHLFGAWTVIEPPPGLDVPAADAETRPAP